jgi:DNA-directed RNA polymerase I, II, and III subunit RPABC1
MSQHGTSNDADIEKVIVAMSAQYKLEEFAEDDLLVNITHHTLVPSHEVLTLEEKKLLLER